MLRSEKSMLWPQAMTQAEKLERLRRAVKSAHGTGCDNFRQLYDDALLDLLGVKHFGDLQRPVSDPVGANSHV